MKKSIKNIKRPNLYDYLKIIALVTMLIDHIGYYIFPEYTFLRVIWRIALPIFLFLVWFSWSYKWRRDIPLLWIFIWIISIYIHNIFWFWTTTANILIWITISRIFLNIINKKKRYLIIIISIIFAVIHPFYAKYVDYWSIPFFLALWWRIARYHKNFFHLWIIPLFWLIIHNICVFDFWFKKWNYFYFYVICFLYFIFYCIFFILSKENITIHTKKEWRDSSILWLSKHALAFYVTHILILIALWLLRFKHL